MKTLGIREAAGEGRIKQHIFLPSGRIVWTVVGRMSEYWLDPHHRYCSCRAHYFGPTGICYHIKCQEYARSASMYDIIEFDDSEFDGFVMALVQDTLAGR